VVSQKFVEQEQVAVYRRDEQVVVAVAGVADLDDAPSRGGTTSTR